MKRDKGINRECRFFNYSIYSNGWPIFAVLKPCGVKANHIIQMKSYTATHAERELEILLKTVKDPIIAPFKEELIALCDRFGKSGQSENFGALPYTRLKDAHEQN